jgi:hypothetical protein
MSTSHKYSQFLHTDTRTCDAEGTNTYHIQPWRIKRKRAWMARPLYASWLLYILKN